MGAPDLEPLPYRIVNAFTTNSPFSGNPAAVVIFSSPSDPRASDDNYLQLVARDFNLSETAYLVPLDVQEESLVRYGLRWFTPGFEVELCGHATLASAHVLFSVHPRAQTISFETRKKGTLTAIRKDANGVEISLPALPTDDTQGRGQGHEINKERVKSILLKAVDPELKEADIVDVVGFAWGQGCYIIEIKAEVKLAELKVDSKILEGIVKDSIIAVTQVADTNTEGTLKINSRVFCPGESIDEDPVTGAAHAALIPYYLQHPSSASRFSKLLSGATSVKDITVDARQVSARGGRLLCTLDGDRVRLVGNAFEMGRGSLTSTADLPGFE